MDDISLAALFSHPVGQIVVTVIVAAITAAITVRMMAAPREAPAPARRAATGLALAAPAEGAIVAARSAAVYAAIGEHRIVYIAPVRPGSSWTAEVRTRHHTSHAPHAHASHH